MLVPASVSYCDGAGLGLFTELRRLAAQTGGRAEIVGLAPDLQQLVDMSALADATAAELEPVPAPGLVTVVGQAVAEILGDLRDIVNEIDYRFHRK